MPSSVPPQQIQESVLRVQPASLPGVLLVDDDAMVARAYERMLRTAGYAVRVAHDAVEAMGLFRRHSFDVIVSDLNMPAMNGLDLLRLVREHDPEVPFILMTGNPQLQTAAAGIEHGALRYLIKPVSPDLLEDAVARAVRLHDSERAQRAELEEIRAAEARKGPGAVLQAAFNRGLVGLWTAYQPIISWADRSVFAYEALVRTEEVTLRNPLTFFEAAENVNCLHQLSRAIRKDVATTIPLIPPSALIFVNVHPSDLRDPTLFDPESSLSAFASRIVLEITERAALDQIPDLPGTMSQLRAMGYRIAVDDLGAGYAGLTSFARLEPEVVKVDMSIVRGIDQSCTKQKLMGSIIGLCRDLNIQLISEGVETPQERDTIIALGGDLYQGYLFARPGKPVPTPDFG